MSNSNKKNLIVFVLIALQFCLYSCKKDRFDICDSHKCIEYFHIWKQLFKTKNNMSDEYFNDHITIAGTEINSWNSGETFHVHYYNEIDWAKIYNNDKFLIKKSLDASPYPSLNLPVEEYLSMEEIDNVVSNFAFGSNITKINPYHNLKYHSKRRAIKAVEEVIQYDGLENDRIQYLTDKPVFTSNGNPFLFGSVTINIEQNICIHCNIDLITGDVSFSETVCWYN